MKNQERMYEDDFCEYPHLRSRSAEGKMFLMKKCYLVSIYLTFYICVFTYLHLGWICTNF